MGLRFILGRAGSGKSSTCVNDIVEKLQAEPDGNPIVYLVPEQMTFQSEYAIVNSPNVDGMIRAQVFSFTRLAWKVLQETGGIARQHINSVGIHMILRNIIEENKQDLKVFQRASEKNGFIDEVEAMVTELKRYCLSAEDLFVKQQQLVNREIEAGNEMLSDKLHDLHLIYMKLEQRLLNKYVDGEDYLRLLAEQAMNSTYLQNAEIIIDGFYQFTPQELEVLQSLLINCREVTVTLTLDQSYDDTHAHELDLFYSIAGTYHKIMDIVAEHDIEVTEIKNLNQNVLPRFRHAPDFGHLEKYWQQRPTIAYDQEPNHIHLNAAVNRRTEVENVAREVLRLVRENNYRFRDITILVRDASKYSDLLKTTFEDYDIPLFLDDKKSMLHHPLVELIRSSLEAISYNWQYDAVFQAAKTTLFFPTVDSNSIKAYQEDLDRLENYVLANGIKGYHWREDYKWQFIKVQLEEEQTKEKTEDELKDEERLMEMRRLIVEPLSLFEKGMSKAKTAKEMATTLFHYLQSLNITEKLDEWKLTAEENGDLQLAKEHDQVWNAIIELLDQCVELFDEDKITLELFGKIIESGLENLKFTLVPPALDQVLVGAVDRSRFSNVKCAFLLGVNEGVFPAKPTEDGLLLEEERELLQNLGTELAPGATQQLLHEQFIVYLAVTSASEKLIVSYPLADEEGKTLLASPIIERLKELFPHLQEKLVKNEPSEMSEVEQLAFITNPAVTLSHLAPLIREWKKGYHLAPQWWDAYNLLITKEWKHKTTQVLSSLFYRNVESDLTNETSLKLYGEQLKTSVSRMELHQSCPFAHFMSYGLKLKERELFRLDVPDIGRLFHAALKEMNDHLTNEGISWKDLERKECLRIVKDIVDKLAPKLQREILLSSNRYGYIKRKLTDVVGRASLILSEQAKASGFEPAGVELAFGQNGKLPPLEIQLSNGVKMEVVGRIDRVDKAESDDGVLLRVIDYKSSARALDMSEVYYGLALQMLTYLDVVITNSNQWLGTNAKPAGVLYFHIHNPFVEAVAKKEEEIEKEIFKKFKMKGYVAADRKIVELMDNTLEKKSNIVPAGFKKDGSFDQHSKVASEEDFDELRKHSRRKIKSIGEEITSGKINISPYQLKKKNPCTYCTYRPVCQFDQGLDENKHRILRTSEDQEVLQKIRVEGSEE